MAVNLWYIDLATNNHNSNAYKDILNDIRELKNGVFSATLRLNQGFITDYVFMRNVDREPTTVNKKAR